MKSLIKFFTHLGAAVLQMGANTLMAIANVYYFMSFIASTVISGFCKMNEGDAWNAAWSFSQKINNAVAIVGFGLFLVYWLMSIIDKVSRDSFEGNEIIRSGLELIVGLVLITNSFTFMKALTTVTDWSIDTVKAAFETDEDDAENDVNWQSACTLVGGNTRKYFKVTDDCFNDVGRMTSPPELTVSEDYYNGEQLGKDSGYEIDFGRAIGYVASLILPFLAVIMMAIVSVITTMIIGAMALSRSIQIIVYIAFAPLAFADTFKDGFINSKAWRYTQKFIALNLQAGIILAVATLGPYVGTSVANNLMGNAKGVTSIVALVTGLIGQLSAVALATKASQISNDIMGV